MGPAIANHHVWVVESIEGTLSASNGESIHNSERGCSPPVFSRRLQICNEERKIPERQACRERDSPSVREDAGEWDKSGTSTLFFLIEEETVFGTLA